ncbi:hypothetical protein BLNAU_24582 [Blattamonas nauphoetae]|uniref:Uncharacterized protein n=1 Tax=Blattamonas nauphoetae TaxID=2049346 RepID=A0ABQ9WM19_9EUKA|nr:hypothetical protein BLNAU_24582 [Blattamonas nauphoetae]
MAIDCILEEDSHPARRIRISYTINHLGQFQIQVLSIPALTSKPFNKTNIDILNYVQRTRQRIVDVPIIDNGGETSPVYVRDVWVDYADGIIRRFILSEGAVCIDPPVPRAYPSASATGSLRHDYGRNERELLHRFPDLSSPIWEYRESAKEEQDWINEVQVHGCRCDETTPVNNFLVNWPKEGGRICPLNVIYTPFEREKHQ